MRESLADSPRSRLDPLLIALPVFPYVQTTFNTHTQNKWLLIRTQMGQKQVSISLKVSSFQGIYFACKNCSGEKKLESHQQRSIPVWTRIPPMPISCAPPTSFTTSCAHWKERATVYSVQLIRDTLGTSLYILRGLVLRVIQNHNQVLLIERCPLFSGSFTGHSAVGLQTYITNHDSLLDTALHVVQDRVEEGRLWFSNSLPSHSTSVLQCCNERTWS